MDLFFEECIQALGSKTEILPTEEKKYLFDILRKKFPMLVSGHIDWIHVNNKMAIENVFDIPDLLKDKNCTVFVLWDNAKVPALKSTLERVLRVIDDVTAVSFYTWVFSPLSGYIIEFGHTDIFVGFFDKK